MNPIDMIGKPCPLPVIEAKKALRAAKPGDRVEMLVDNDIARQNLEKMAESLSHGFSHVATADGNILVTIEAREAHKPAKSGGAGTVVAIGRNCMGSGDDSLGAMLMKSFIHSLTELDSPPARILFFNGGVRLACNGSGALDDLRSLAARGAVIDSCGACLNFYGLADKRAVGGVTNMLSIAEAMADAKNLINL